VQTFMPLGDFAGSARVLDSPRLNKQRVEAKQILMVLSGETTAWRNHPAVIMWQGYQSALADYGFEMCVEWMKRGGKDHAQLQEWFAARIDTMAYYVPEWVYNSDLNLSHRSNLLRKDEAFYRPLFGHYNRSDMPYLWPVWDDQNMEWLYRISVSESKRSGWSLPDYLSYDPKTRYVGLAA